MRKAIVKTTTPGKLAQTITIEEHSLVSDEPLSNGGENLGPAPHDFLLAALGSCTSITLSMYARTKGYPLESVEVALEQEKAADGTHVFHRKLTLNGALNDEQRARLLAIADKCPVHKTLSGKIAIQTALV